MQNKRIIFPFLETYHLSAKYIRRCLKCRKPDRKRRQQEPDGSKAVPGGETVASLIPLSLRISMATE